MPNAHSNQATHFLNNTSISNTSPLTHPTNFYIASLYSGSRFGGYDGNCIIGISQFTVESNPTSLNRAILFDAHQDSFFNIVDNIPNSTFYYC